MAVNYLTLPPPISWASNRAVLGPFLGRPPRVLPTCVVVDEPHGLYELYRTGLSQHAPALSCPMDWLAGEDTGIRDLNGLLLGTTPTLTGEVFRK